MLTNDDSLVMMAHIIQSGGNPKAIIQQMAMQNPQARMAMQMVNGKSGKNVEQLVRNMAKERGVDIDALAAHYGIQIPHNSN